MPISIVLDNGWTIEMYADKSGFINPGMGEDESGYPLLFDIWWKSDCCRSDRCIFIIGEDEDGTPIDIKSDGTVVLRSQSGAVKGRWF